MGKAEESIECPIHGTVRSVLMGGLRTCSKCYLNWMNLDANEDTDEILRISLEAGRKR